MRCIGFLENRETDFEITCVMRVLGSVLFAQASIRACRLEPLPEIRTVRLCCDSDIVDGCEKDNADVWVSRVLVSRVLVWL
jgi:hypothetical protein